VIGHYDFKPQMDSLRSIPFILLLARSPRYLTENFGPDDSFGEQQIDMEKDIFS
jgi:hypothetical protein